MKREKARQLRRRRRQKMILKRCILAAACVAVVLLVISGVWALVKPAVGKGGKKDQSEQAVMEVEASKEESTEKAVSPTPTKEAEPSAQPEEESGAKAVNADAAAQRAAIATGTEVTYAVPGWQVDDTGWWYANDDGTYFTNGWQEIDGQEYYFNAEGYMQTGWAVVGNKGCYFSEEGIYEPDKESKMVALTFDDGPGDHTDELLDILEENNAKATFFMLGENVAAKGADVIPRMIELGCELGNHSYDHPNLMELDGEGIQDQFNRTDQEIAKISGGPTATLARTPFGAQDDSVTSYIEKPCIYWSLDTLDWQTKDVDSNISAVLDHVSDGEIILMHDIWPTTVESCATIIPALIEEGYQLVTVSELAAAKGVAMENGVTYYDFYPDTDATAGGADSDGSEEDAGTESGETTTESEESETE
ncbi:MAG TPA: polysaccharide deacetylase family protein [Candidatus Ruminococcus avistercoris]|nr:polysaccharide deacetylase family protein [Candidatus Ruminococcus avistercoris]